jgi:SAM-dependent methyltransferase
VNNATIVALDILEEMLALLRGKHPGKALVIRGDATSLPFISNSIPSIISFGNLEHIARLEDALKEIIRVMTDDGEFIWGIPTEGLLYMIGRKLTTQRHVEKATGVDYNELIAKEHVNGSRDILEKLKMYFKIEEVRGVPFVIPLIDLNFVLVGKCRKK